MRSAVSCGVVVRGWVTYMSGKIAPSVGDVAVPSFWLDPTMTAAWRGLGGSGFNTDPNLEHVTPIFGSGVGKAGMAQG